MMSRLNLVYLRARFLLAMIMRLERIAKWAMRVADRDMRRLEADRIAEQWRTPDQHP